MKTHEKQLAAWDQSQRKTNPFAAHPIHKPGTKAILEDRKPNFDNHGKGGTVSNTGFIMSPASTYRLLQGLSGFDSILGIIPPESHIVLSDSLTARSGEAEKNSNLIAEDGPHVSTFGEWESSPTHYAEAEDLTFGNHVSEPTQKEKKNDETALLVSGSVGKPNEAEQATLEVKRAEVVEKELQLEEDLQRRIESFKQVDRKTC